MPLASAPPRPDVVYGFGRINASGRVADQATITALGWRGGDLLTATADAGVMIARRDPGGMVTVPTRPYIVIPAAQRGRCGPVTTGEAWPDFVGWRVNYERAAYAVADAVDAVPALWSGPRMFALEPIPPFRPPQGKPPK